MHTQMSPKVKSESILRENHPPSTRQRGQKGLGPTLPPTLPERGREGLGPTLPLTQKIRNKAA